MTNPLLSRTAIPAFDAVKPEDYQPAVDLALAGVQDKLAAIKAAPASFANTVVPLESLFDELNDIMDVLYLATANTYTKQLGDIQSEVQVQISDLTKTVYQDRDLGALFQQVYSQRDTLPLGADDRTILRDLYWQFESSGAFLSQAGQDRIRAIDAELIKLAATFHDNLQAAPKQQAVLITDRAELAGLSDDEIEILEKHARDNGHAQGWLFLPERLLVDEWLEKAEVSSFRRKMLESLERMGTQAPYDNEPVVAQMQKLRHEYADLLGYPNYASFARTRTMKNLDEAEELLDQVGKAALAKFEDDMHQLEQFSASNGGPAKLEPWDVPFWAAKQRTALYHFDAAEFSKYLPMENVLQGMFKQAGIVGNVDYVESAGKYPVVHPDIRTYDVTDRATGNKSILHVDLYARPGTKSGGAWMSQLQAGSATRPAIIILNMNISKPSGGKTPLVALSQLDTTYHENGHSLQGLVAQRSKYRSLNSVYGPSDFIEIHSIINEPRATLHDNLLSYARHVDTGLPPDAATLAAMEASSSHFQARELLKLVQNAKRDLAFHMTAPEDYKGTKQIEADVAFDSPYQDHIRAYTMTRFGHLFEEARGAYVAAYVDYLIAQEHAADGFEPVKDDPYNPAWLARLREFYNPAAGSPVGDWAQRYRDYRGRDATPDAMLRRAGALPPAP